MQRSPTTGAEDRWIVLSAAVFAQTSTSMFQFGIPFLIPEIREALGVSLEVAAILVACPSIGMIFTLIGWGHHADRLGDRWVMFTGLLGAAVMLAFTAAAGSALALGALLVLAGGFGASVNVTSGRVILKSFGEAQRGLAMGVRQTSPLLGMGFAALLLPRVAGARGFEDGLLLAAGICTLAAVVAFKVIGSARVTNTTSLVRSITPYRAPHLWRLHGASTLLVVPQIGVYSFVYLYLIEVEQLPTGPAGVAVAVALVAGAFMRLVAGVWSDRVKKRLEPMRALALVSTMVVALSATLVLVQSPVAALMLLVATAVSASWNGLAFTAVAEYAGHGWAGRALGTQNTVQYIATAAAPLGMALVIANHGYALAFYAAAIVGLAGALLIPVQW